MSIETPRHKLRYDPALSAKDSWRLHRDVPGEIEVRISIGETEHLSTFAMRWKRMFPNCVFAAPMDSVHETWLCAPVVIVKGLLPVSLQLSCAPAHVAEAMSGW
jgi:hypothetical protein